MQTATPLDATSVATVLAQGEVVDRYVVERLDHRGDAAEVYRVRHTTLGLRRALKVLTEPGAVPRARFTREAEVLAGLEHPNIVPVHDVLEVRGHPALLLDDMEGGTLRGRLDRGRLPIDEAISLFRGIVAGVSAAHDSGVLHRDLTPEVIWLSSTDRGFIPRIADFGVARRTAPLMPGAAPTAAPAAGPNADPTRGPNARLTAPGVMVGTPGYAAPECLSGAAPADVRSDVFSLGCVLYELVCGVAPFRRPTVVQTQLANFNVAFTAPDLLTPDLPGPVRETLVRCLVADPEHRLQSCAAILACLRAPVPPRFVFPETTTPFGQLTRIPADPTTPARPAPRAAAASWRRVRLALLGLGLGGVALTGVALRVFGDGGTAGPVDARGGIEAGGNTATDDAGRDTRLPGGTAADTPQAIAPRGATGAPDAAAVRIASTEAIRTDAIRTAAIGTAAVGTAAVGTAAAGTGAAGASTPIIGATATDAAITAEGATAVWLLQGDRPFATGVVPPGTYTILASFGSGAPVEAGQVRVAAGDSVHVRCNADFLQCRP